MMRVVQFIILLGCFTNALAQFKTDSIENPQYFGFNTHYGTIFAHSQDVVNISESNPWGVQLDWSKLMTSQQSWNNCNCYSRIGLSLAYFNFDNPEVLGNAYNLIVFAEPYVTFRKRFFYSFRAGAGINYLNKVHDELSNPSNLFYSTHISGILLTNVTANYKLNTNWTANLAVYYSHISNGGMKHPNKGINFPTLSLGLLYTPEPVDLQPRNKVKGKAGQLKGYARIFSSMRTVDADADFPEVKALEVGIHSGILVWFAPFNAVNVGVELTRDNSFKESSRRMNTDYDHHVIALILGHNLIFGSFTFNQQMAFYAYKPFPFTSKKFYQRYELLYQISKRWSTGISLKAHGHVADHMDIRFGLVF